MSIYPMIDVRSRIPENNGSAESQMREIELSTRLRKLHDGKYYFWDFWQKRTVHIEEIADLINHWHAEIYMSMILGVVDPSLRAHWNNVPIFKLDPNQTPENERLKKLIP